MATLVTFLDDKIEVRLSVSGRHVTLLVNGRESTLSVDDVAGLVEALVECAKETS